ncbi:MAG: hypothetical protein L6R38_009062 [Xanthoria sp. 2 TBL-2021]|nr:MAG: hypothetical protein L6R38_009062 [Xanthoria sp. 2 TBL-2021]
MHLAPNVPSPAAIRIQYKSTDFAQDPKRGLCIVAVRHKATAVLLGQTNQLVVVGLVLSIMAFITQQQVQKVILLYEARYGASTLQNFDGILQRKYFDLNMTWQPRLVLWFLFILPLGLGASYKQFSGGSTKLILQASDMHFGATAAPGYQLIGNGLSLLVTAYLPFWLNPAVRRTYGFNLLIADNATAAILDAPFPSFLTDIQESLKVGQSVLMSAQVNATVTQNLNPSTSERDSPEYWQETQDSYSTPNSSKQILPGHVGMGMWTGQNSRYNWSLTYLSRWDQTEGQTFESQAERFFTTRRTCIGTWNITQANVSLVNASILQTAEQANQKQQSVFQNNTLSIGGIYLQFLDEFNWAHRRRWNQRLPDSSRGDPKFVPSVNTRPALVSAMLWSRLVSLNGPERDSDYGSSLFYPKTPSEITLVKQSRTLTRSALLIVILSVHPVLTMLAVLAKALLYGTPISDDFGLISLLAGIQGNGIEKLRGAALSGKLNRTVRIRFDTRDDVGGEALEYHRLGLEVDSQKKSDSLEAKRKYG